MPETNIRFSQSKTARDRSQGEPRGRSCRVLKALKEAVPGGDGLNHGLTSDGWEVKDAEAGHRHSV